MSEAQIDRLILDLPAMSQADAKRVAIMVATGLAQSHGLSGAADIPSMRVLVEGAVGNNLSMLTNRIVADALRQIQRTP